MTNIANFLSSSSIGAKHSSKGSKLNKNENSFWSYLKDRETAISSTFALYVNLFGGIVAACIFIFFMWHGMIWDYVVYEAVKYLSVASDTAFGISIILGFKKLYHYTYGIRLTDYEKFEEKIVAVVCVVVMMISAVVYFNVNNPEHYTIDDSRYTAII